MNRLTSRQRQLVYLAGILVLMVPIIVLGMPATGSDGALGWISQKRIDYELGEPSLGNVDPASATMNLVLLGMRGIAANLLWMEADHLKETKNWSQLEAAVESIILLQPHFQSVWKFQAWNLGYNVSAECDAVPDRYFYVKKGMKFLMRGTERNQKVPELYHDLGDYFGKKIGRSDEKLLFRRYFLKDPDEERWKGGPDEEINPERKDNYLVAKDWYVVANDKVNQPGIEQHKMALPLFMTYPYRSQMDYAAALQNEGSFGEITREAWGTGYREWTEEYGRTEFATPGGMVVFEATEGELVRMAEEDGTPPDQKIYWQGRYQDMVNYRYWKLRCNVERSPDMAGARHDFALGRKQFREEQDLPTARDTLYSGLEKMQRVVDEYRLADGTSQLLNDETELVEDSIKAILIWQHILSLLGDPVPEEFPMDEVWTDPRHEPLRVSLYQDFLRWQGGTL
jgi:hypothetical protein